jgi:hypothetical protein
MVRLPEDLTGPIIPPDLEAMAEHRRDDAMLEKWFGPHIVRRDTGEIRYDAQWHDQPENIRGVLSEFFRVLGGRPEGKARKHHVAAAREFVAAIGERPDIVEACIEANIRDGLGVASLRSLIASGLVLKYKQRRTVAENQETVTMTLPYLCEKCGNRVGSEYVLSLACGYHKPGGRTFGPVAGRVA